MDYRISDVRTDVNARDCTRGCTDTVRESALKVDHGVGSGGWVKNPMLQREIEPVSVACQSDALPLSYIFTSKGA